jgi:hypothetical protein
MPIVRQKMIEFVNSGGLTIAGSKGLYIKNNPTIVAPQKASPIEDDRQYKGMTPKERLAKKKEQETLRKMEEAREAARAAHSNYQKASQMMYNQLYASNKGGAGGVSMPFEQTVIHSR